MEKYTQLQDLPIVHDTPPSYNQTFNPAPSASTPASDFTPTVSSGPGPIQFKLEQTYAQPQTVFVQSAVIPPLGPRPCMVTCPSCQQQQMSKVIYETATKTHLIAALLCIVGLVCCTCIPYCVDTCKNPDHYCSNCDAYLGTYNK